MKNRILIILFALLFFATSAYAATFGGTGLGPIPLTIEEEDGVPSVTGTNTIQFTDGTMTNDGGGVVSIDILGVAAPADSPTFTSDIEWADGNVTWVPCGDDIETYVTAATAGDTLILCAGTYTVTDDIDVTKAITIRGQGYKGTIIQTATDSKNVFHITSSDVEIENLGIDITASATHAIYTTGVAGAVLDNIFIHDVDIVLNSHAGAQHALCFVDSNGDVQNVEIEATSTNNDAFGVYAQNEATAEAATIVHVHQVHAILTGAGGGTSIAYRVEDDSATSDCSMYIYNSHGVTTGGVFSAGISSLAGANAIAYAEFCYLDAGDYDFYQAAGATMSARNCLSANNTSLGTITYPGKIEAATLNTEGIVINETTDTNSYKTINNTLTDTSTTGHTVYGQYNTITNDVVVTGTAQSLYGERTWVEKSGADTNADTTSVYGAEFNATNTGSTDAGTKNTYGLEVQAVGDTAGDSTAYGITSSARGADVNYSIFSDQGNIELRLEPAEEVSIDASPTTNTDGVLRLLVDTVTTGVVGAKIELENEATAGQANTALYVDLTNSAVVTTDNLNFYGAEISVTKSGADTSTDGVTLTGINVQAQSTGSTDAASTKTATGGYFAATGDTAGTSTAYGIRAAASGADTNWAGYFEGDVNVTGLLDIDGVVTLGDGGDNFSVASDGIDISTAGVITNSTFDAGDNVLKMFGYIQLINPHLAGSGVEANMDTTATNEYYGQVKFADEIDKATNYCEYRLIVPTDLDIAVALTASFKFRLGGADTDDHVYAISHDTVADSADYTGTVTDEILLAYTKDGSGADGDVETASGTLTSWKDHLTAGNLWVIRVARDGDANSGDDTDDSNVDSYSGPLTIRYGVTQ